MTFEEYIAQAILLLRIDIEAGEHEIWKLETALKTYQDYKTGCPATETPQEALPAPVATEVAATPADQAPETPSEHDAAFGPVTHAIVDVERVDLRRKKWTPEMKAAASERARESWPNRANRSKLPPVEDRPRAEFKKPIGTKAPETEPMSQFSATIEVKDDTLERIKKHQGAALKEPKPAWSDPTPEKQDIVTIEGCPLSISGAVLFRDGKYIAHLNKHEKAVLEELIQNFGSTVQRSKLNTMVDHLDNVILRIRPWLGEGVMVETTNCGLKLVAVQKEAV